MAYSIYETNGYQDIAKPSDLMSENYYLQDVFFNTRPEVFNFNDTYEHTHDHERHPSFRERDRDEKENKGDKLKDDQTFTVSPHNWDEQEGYLVKKSDKVSNIISLYNLENNPIHVKFKNIYSTNNKVAITLSNLARTTSEFSRKYAPGVVMNSDSANTDKSEYIFAYNVKGYEPWSKRDQKRSHKVLIQLEKNPKIKDLRSLDVKLSCDCGFFQYYGPAWNADTKNYLHKDFEPAEPNKFVFKEPEEDKKKNLICKHVYAVASYLKRLMISMGLDTFEDVAKIIKKLEEITTQFGSDKSILVIKDMVDKLPISQRKDLIQLLKKYSQHTTLLTKFNRGSDKTKILILKEIMDTLKNILDVQSKDFLDDIQRDFKNVLTIMKRQQEKEDRENKERLRKEELAKKEEEKRLEKENKQNAPKIVKQKGRSKNILKKLIKKSNVSKYDLNNIILTYLEENGR